MRDSIDAVPQKDTADPEIPATVEFGARCRAARKARGWSQWDLARAVTPQISQATVSAIERGEGASSSILSICKALDISPPVVGESADMQRWIDAGRVLARFPEVFEYHLRQLETLAATLAGARTDPDGDPVTPGGRRH